MRSIGILLSGLIFVLTACKGTVELPPGLVAQVDNSFLVMDELNLSVPEGIDEESALALRKQIINKWVEDEVFYQTALKEGFDLSKQDEYLIKEYTRSLVIKKFLDSRLNRDYKIPEKEIEDYYQANRSQFVADRDEAHLIHLLVSHRDNAIFSEIAGSSDLMAIIKKYYFDEKSTTERPNGDIGYVRTSDLPKEFVTAISGLKTGAISKPVQTDQGFHFLQLKHWQKAGSMYDLPQVRDEIIIRLKKNYRDQELERMRREMKEAYHIQTYLSKIQE